MKGRGSLEVHFDTTLRINYWHLTLLDMRHTFDTVAVSTLLDHHRTPEGSSPSDAMELADAFMKTIDTACNFMTSDWGLPVHALRSMEVCSCIIDGQVL